MMTMQPENGTMIPLYDSQSLNDQKLEIKMTLSSTTLAEYLSSRPPSTVITVTPATTIEQLSHLLSVHQILSAPIVDDQGSYCGFVDAIDAFGLVSASTNNIHQCVADLGEKLSSTTIRSLQRANDGQSVSLNSGNDVSLLDIVQQGFLNPSNKLWCHRVAVTDAAAANKVIAIISQSDIIRYIYRQRFNVPGLMMCTLSQLGFKPQPAVCVPHDMPALTAFASMAANDVNSVAVLQHGHLVAALSASDLRGLSSSELNSLELPVLEFIEHRAAASAEKHIPTSLASQYGIHRAPAATQRLQDPSNIVPAACTMDAKLENLLKLFVDRGVHRVFILGSGSGVGNGTSPSPHKEGSLVGLISTSDVLRVLC